jgi:type VI secretion system protein ImpH
MATKSGGADAPLERLLGEEGYRFDFFEAVRLLERLYPNRQPVGRDTSPSQEVVRFRSHLSMTFPPSAIHEIAPAENGSGPTEMTVAFMGLIGPLGALPRHYTELVLERARAKDRTLYDFLDLFHHRLISLFYRAWEKYRFPIAYERGVSKREGYDSFSLALFDLIGMGTAGLRGRLAVEDEALLSYAGLLAQHPRSASALEGLLRDCFGVPVRVVQFSGQWLLLSPEHCSQLGPGETHNALGVSAVAGSRSWDPQAKFTVGLGPLTYAEFCRFLPCGDAFRALVAMTRFFAGQECDFDVQLRLRAAEVPACHLGHTGASAPRLGWSAWLTSEAFAGDAENTILAGRIDHRGLGDGWGTAHTERGQHAYQSEVADQQAE